MALGGLLAAAIHNMDGVAGIHGWAWIFILEGLATILFAFTSLFILQDFPQTAKMLTEEERVYIIRGLQADHQHSAGSGECFRMSVVWQTLKDPKTYIASEPTGFSAQQAIAEHVCALQCGSTPACEKPLIWLDLR